MINLNPMGAAHIGGAIVDRFFDDYDSKNEQVPLLGENEVQEPVNLPAGQQLLTKQMITIRQKTEYVDSSGRLLSNADINNRIIQKIQGIYSVDSVTVNQTQFEFGGSTEKRPARKIEIVRTWGWYDIVPLGVFLPTLLDANSVYHKTINTNSVQDFILGARPKISEVKMILGKLELKSNLSKEELREMNTLIEDKYNKDSRYEIIPEDRTGKSAHFLSNFERHLELFRNEYESITLEGRNNLLTAYWKSKSLTLYLPEEIQDNNLEAYIEVPKNSGVTPMAINIATALRSCFVCDKKNL